MPTNLELLKVVMASGSPLELENAALNMAQRLDVIANMKAESPVGELQLITSATFFHTSRPVELKPGTAESWSTRLRESHQAICGYTVKPGEHEPPRSVQVYQLAKATCETIEILLELLELLQPVTE